MPEVLVVSGGGGEVCLVAVPGLALLLLAAMAGGPLPTGTPFLLGALVVLVVAAVVLGVLAMVALSVAPYEVLRLVASARRALQPRRVA